MKKKFLVLFLLFFAAITLTAEESAQPNKPTPEQEQMMKEKGDDLEGFYELEDPELEVFVEFGDDLQSETAQNILRYRKQRDELKQDKERLEQLKKTIPKGAAESFDAANSIQKAIDKKTEDIAKLDKQHEEEKEELRALSIARKAAKQAEEKGDPVKITRGSYKQSEEDFASANLQLFLVNRNYDSESCIYSSFGYGWSTNLDERIILGINPGAEEIYLETKALISQIKSKILEQTAGIIVTYKVTSVETGREEIINRMDNIISGFESFKSRAESYSFHDYVSYADKTIEVLKAQKSLMLTNYDRDIKTLENLKKTLKEKEAENIINKKKLDKSNDRKTGNTKAMFRDMDSSYEETGLETLTVIDEGGYPHILSETAEDSGIWENEKDKDIKECRLVTDGGYEITLSDGIVKSYDSNGFLVKVKDTNGNTVCIDRNFDEKIRRVYDSYGEELTFVYEGGYIKSITNKRDQTENAVYSYKDGKLVSVKDRDGDTVTMEYDADGQMTLLKKCDGSTVQFVYGEQTKDRKLTTSTVNEEAYAEYFSYEKGRTIYTDHDGNVSITYYDDSQRTTREEKSDGSVVINDYDEDGNLAAVNQNGERISYEYDGRRNRTRAFYLSDSSEEKWTYNSFNQVTSYIDRDGVIYEYLRDEKGNLVEYKVNGKTVYSQRVNDKGQVVQRTVCGQNEVTTDYVYDDNGNLKSQTCDGVKTEYEYDERNRVKIIKQDNKTITEYFYEGRNVIQKDYNGLETTYITNGRKDMTDVIQKDSVTGTVHKTRIEYDRRHLPLRVYSGDGESEALVTSYLYTPEGKIKAQVSYGQESWITLYEYENGSISEVKQFRTPAVPEPVEGLETINALLLQAGENVYIQKYDHKIQSGNKKLLTVTDGLGIQTLFEYDSNGNLVKTTDGNREVRSINYTKAGRVNGEQSGHGGWYRYEYEDGNLWKAGEENGSYIQSTYYSDGSQRSVTDRYGKTTYYNYDSRGRVSSIISDSQKVWYEYDNFDRVTKEVVGNSPDEYSALYYVTYDYSDDGRAVTVTEGGKYKTTSELDAFGNVIKQTDGNGNTRRYEYNSLKQLTKSYDGYENETNYEYNALGNVSLVVQPDGAKTEYKYNYMGLLYKVTDDCGIVYTAEYDKAGRLVKEKSRADSEKSYKYDDGGRIKEIWCGGEIVESYNYGKDSRTVTVKDGNGEDYIYNYDAYGRLTDEVNRNGLKQFDSYDSDCQMNGQTNFDGSTTTIVYSENRTVRTVKYSDGSENRFVYDSLGNIIEAQNAYGKTIYRYDQSGRMIYQKDVTTGEEIRFYYDDAGNRTTLLSSNRETVYTYGQNNEVKEIFDNKQRLSVKLEYDKNGREVLRKFGNGTEETTLYDEAGRVTVKAQRSDRGELQWAEGYLYGSDGKRTATVDNKGFVTLYEYNKKGQLSTVYYPYSQEMINLLKSEAEENGLPVNAELGENRFLPSDIKSGLTILMNSMQYTLAYKLTNMQIFIKESYGYDKNGNRITKTTKYGTINYNYDKENCLVSSGSKGQTFVTYTYDNMGNLLTEESALKSTKYAYNSQNRLIYCEVTDKSNREYAQTNYAYDAFGRRILVQDKGEAALRTLYDGLTFDVIKQSPTFENGLFTDSQNTGIQWERTGKPTGERYRYISGENTKDDARYVYLDENAYRIKNTRYTGERTQISVNGTLAAQSSSEGTQYFTTDLFGSVSSISDSSGYQIGSYTYDTFGSLIQGDLTGSTDFGYLGKQNDPTSRLYNYGYRDYKPEAARFTTVDPVRDGTNWFSYVNNDPVNFVDLWGLIQIKIPALYTMQGGKWSTKPLNGDSSYTIGDSGCAIICASNMLDVNPIEINDKYVSEGNLQWYEIGNDYGYTVIKENKGITKQEYLQQAADQENTYTTFINVNWNDSHSDHWVGMNGIETINGKEYCVVTISSINDTAINNTTIKQNENGDYFYDSYGNNRLGKGWLNENGQVLIPLEQVKGSVTFIKNCTK